MKRARPTPREIAQAATADAAAAGRAAGAQARLAARLGFDCYNGGRRFGELTVLPCGDGSNEVLLSIDTTVVTVKQARSIRNILTCRACATGRGTVTDEGRCPHCGAEVTDGVHDE